MKTLRKQAGYEQVGLGFIGLGPFSIVLGLVMAAGMVFALIYGIRWAATPSPAAAARMEVFQKGSDRALFAAPKNLQTVDCAQPKNGEQLCRFTSFDGWSAKTRHAEIPVSHEVPAYAFTWSISEQYSELKVADSVPTPGQAAVEQYLTRVLKASPL